jgi:16S rRNA (cytosine967-C5)-methyltransferase
VQIAARLRGEGNVICVERDEKKVRAWNALVERAGVTNASIVLGDAREAAPDLRASGVLLDAPCSGIGVIGRHPEARWRKTPQDGARLAEGQAELLRAAGQRTAPGGRLVYSVCSNDRREGRDVIDAFLAETPAFARAALPGRYAPFNAEGDVVVPAGIEGRDGFYIAVLARTA